MAPMEIERNGVMDLFWIKPDLVYRYPCCYADGGSLEAMERIYTEKKILPYSVDRIPKMWIDGGGACRVDEPKTYHDVNGFTVGFFTYQVPILLETVKNLKPREWGGYYFRGQYETGYAISASTREALIVALEQVNDPLKASQAQADHRKALEQAGGAYLAKCSCGSKQLYVQCCGKTERRRN